MQKSERHSKITGDIGESLILYFLSKSNYEPAFVDYTGIDIIAYEKTDNERIGVSVKSRSRTMQRPIDGLKVEGSDYQKIIDSCEYFGAKAYICFVIDVPSTEKSGTIHLFLMPIITLLNYHSKFKYGESFTFSISPSNIEKYNRDLSIKKLKFDYTSQDW